MEITGRSTQPSVTVTAGIERGARETAVAVGGEYQGDHREEYALIVVLPLALLLAVPLWWLVRRRRRDRAA